MSKSFVKIKISYPGIQTFYIKALTFNVRFLKGRGRNEVIILRLV